MNIYQEQILDHYQNPRNFYNMSDSTHKFMMQNLSCGDEVEMFLKVDSKGKVEKASFEAEGCSISIASASMLTEFLVGKNINDVKAFDYDVVLDLLGIPLTTARLKCAVMSLEAVKKSINHETV